MIDPFDYPYVSLKNTINIPVLPALGILQRNSRRPQYPKMEISDTKPAFQVQDFFIDGG
jgi:hypothetical protein